MVQVHRYVMFVTIYLHAAVGDKTTSSIDLKLVFNTADFFFFK